MVGIYMIRNNGNNKVYIGQSIDVDRRRYEHFSKLKRGNHYNSYLQNAYNKDPESLTFSVLLECDIDDLNKHEAEMIAYYNATDRKYGYNLDIRATGPGRVSDETRKRQSLASPIKRAVVCVETGDAYVSARSAATLTGNLVCSIRDCCIGRRNSARGLHWAFLSDYIANPWVYPTTPGKIVRRRSVICTDTGKQYETVGAASRDTGIKTSKICDCCAGKLKSVHGYHWMYAD